MIPRSTASSPPPVVQVSFAALFGAFLGLSLLKFGNPPIMEKWVSAPANVFEVILGSPWPIAWAYALFLPLVILGILGFRRGKLASPVWAVFLPLAWLAYVLFASLWTVDVELSRPTLAHFAGCVACFYLGFFCLNSIPRLAAFWPGILIGFSIVIMVGFQQHFGGLDQTRQYFYAYILPRLKEVPPEYLKKMASSRIFSTLFYPNALAGAILLILPAMLEFLWQLRNRFTVGARALLVTSLAFGGLACLYWSGSKGGWLLMLVLALLWVFRLPFSPVLKRNIVIAMVVLGVLGFFLRYAAFFQKGATSVTARFDYWQAALSTTLSHPLTGTGPGTFSIAYQRVKRPESEMSRLVHNDYLEQASDSGLPAFIIYALFISSVLFVSYPRLPVLQAEVRRPGTLAPAIASSIRFAVWLGVLGWALQGFAEFGLYIPGLAWPAFTFLGWLLSQSDFHQRPARPESNRQVASS
jgi:O-antigen ligase